jgi:phage terminase large subunit-like protein
MSFNRIKKKLELLERRQAANKSTENDLSCKDVSLLISQLKERFESCKQYIADKDSESVQSTLNSFIQSCFDNISTIYDLRFVCRYNLFFLITLVFNKTFMYRDWTFQMTKECQINPNGNLQLWSRGHFKTSIWTNGKTIQDVLISHGIKDEEEHINKELINIIYNYLFDEIKEKKFNYLKERYEFKEEACVGIFSATKKLAEAFLIEIKTEFETNDILKKLFFDILFESPALHSDRWSVQNGIQVKRNTNRKEATIEAWGLVIGQPTSKHFTICVFDDILTHDFVKTVYMNQVVINSFENAFNLGSHDGIFRAVGTRKHFSDAYSNMIERNVFKAVICSPFGKSNSFDDDIKKLRREEKPILLTTQQLNDIRIRCGENTFFAEIMQNPILSSELGLDFENIQKHFLNDYTNVSLYMYCDPANSKKKYSDYTCYIVIAIDKEDNILLIDGIRDRLKLSERWEEFYKLYLPYKNHIKNIFYEEIGMTSDSDHFKVMMNNIGHFFFNKFEVIRSTTNKDDRIRKMQPFFKQKKIFLPASLMKKTIDNRIYDLCSVFIKEEVSKYPNPDHDDMLDNFARCVEHLSNGKISSIVNDGEDLDDFYNVRKFNEQKIARYI